MLGSEWANEKGGHRFENLEEAAKDIKELLDYLLI